MDALELKAHKLNLKTAEYARQVLKKDILEEAQKTTASEIADQPDIKSIFKEALKECLDEYILSDRRKIETSANVETFILLRKFIEKQDDVIVADGHETAKEFLEKVGIV